MPRILLDFDGVLHSYTSGWTGVTPIDPPNEGSQQFVQDLLDSGFDVVIFTSRATHEGGKVAVDNWLFKWRFPPDLHITAEKMPATAIVDDRAVKFESNNWGTCMDAVQTLRNLNYKKD